MRFVFSVDLLIFLLWQLIWLAAFLLFPPTAEQVDHASTET